MAARVVADIDAGADPDYIIISFSSVTAGGATAADKVLASKIVSCLAHASAFPKMSNIQSGHDTHQNKAQKTNKTLR